MSQSQLPQHQIESERPIVEEISHQDLPAVVPLEQKGSKLSQCSKASTALSVNMQIHPQVSQKLEIQLDVINDDDKPQEQNLKNYIICLALSLINISGLIIQGSVLLKKGIDVSSYQMAVFAFFSFMQIAACIFSVWRLIIKNIELHQKKEEKDVENQQQYFKFEIDNNENMLKRQQLVIGFSGILFLILGALSMYYAYDTLIQVQAPKNYDMHLILSVSLLLVNLSQIIVKKVAQRKIIVERMGLDNYSQFVSIILALIMLASYEVNYYFIKYYLWYNDGAAGALMGIVVIIYGFFVVSNSIRFKSFVMKC